MKPTVMIALLAGAITSSAIAVNAAGLPAAAPTVIAASSLNGARDLGRAATSTPVDLAVVLPYRHAADLTALIAAQNTPRSPYFHRYLSAAQFRAYFSPTPAAYAAAAAKLTRSGFHVDTYVNRTVLHAAGAAAAADALFGTTLDTIRRIDGSIGYANVTPARLPAELAGSRVAGLTTAAVVTPPARDRSSAPVRPAYGGGPFGPDGGFGPAAIASSEDMPVLHGYSGKNVIVGDIMDGSIVDSDVNAFLSYFGKTRGAQRAIRRRVDGGCPFVCADDPTATQDAEWILALAPNTTMINYQTDLPLAYISADVDGFNAVVSDDAVNIAQFEGGGCEVGNADFALALQQVVSQGVSEGITFVVPAFGGANLCHFNLALPMAPADLDSVTAVGGSNVILSGSGSVVAQSAYIGSNGGVSLAIDEPTWQSSTKGVNPAGRNVPDVVVPALIDGVGASSFLGGSWAGGGASVNSSPFTGYLASVASYYGYATLLGNVNPALYSVFDAGGYGKGKVKPYADIAAGEIGTVGGVPVLATKGYDIATGIGSINDGYVLMKNLGY